MKKKTMSSPYREVASRLKKLLSEGMVIEGSLYRSDRGATPRHQLSDRAAGKYRNIFVPEDFAPLVAEWSANWAKAKALLKEMSAVARAELVEAITERTGRRTVGRPGKAAPGKAERPAGLARGASGAPRRRCPTGTRRSRG
jgi:hypothetical protein